MKGLLPLFLATVTALPAAAQDRVPIRFEPGTSGARINGTIKGNEYIDCVLRARAGQTMAFSLKVAGTNGHGSIYLNVLPAGKDFPALYNGSMDDDRKGEVVLPKDGAWAIRTCLMGNDRDAGKTVGYSIEVSIR